MEYRGITVKIDADLHAEVRQYLEANNMTMAEFVSQSLDDELHPKFQKEDMKMENTRTIAFQVPEDLFPLPVSPTLLQLPQSNTVQRDRFSASVAKYLPLPGLSFSMGS